MIKGCPGLSRAAFTIYYNIIYNILRNVLVIVIFEEM